jgi:hypothetical protein
MAPPYAADFVGVSCPAEARSGERPVAYVEYRNTGTQPWTISRTLLATANPRDHDGIFFDMVNWVRRDRPSGVDHDTAPGAVGRFSFVLGIPEVTTDTTLAENYALAQEGGPWFGPSDTTVRCSVRVHPRTAPPPPPPPPEGDAASADATEPPTDGGSTEDTSLPTDDAPPSPAEDGGSLRGDDATPGATPDEGAGGGCGCRAARAPSGFGALTLGALGALFARGAQRRGRRRR